jgi:hypothetical protein
MLSNEECSGVCLGGACGRKGDEGSSGSGGGEIRWLCGGHGACNGARAWGGNLRGKGNHGVWILGGFEKDAKAPSVAPTFS